MQRRKIGFICACLSVCLLVLIGCGGQQVSKEEWDKAVSMEGIACFEAVAKTDKATSTIAKADGKIKHVTKDEQGNTIEKFFHQEGDSYALYLQEQGKWVKKDSSKAEYDRMLKVANLIGAPSMSYDAYTFQGGKYVYKTQGELGGIDAVVTISVIIREGKLSEMKVASTIQAGGKDTSITTTLNITYESVEISLPIVA